MAPMRLLWAFGNNSSQICSVLPLPALLRNFAEDGASSKMYPKVLLIRFFSATIS